MAYLSIENAMMRYLINYLLIAILSLSQMACTNTSPNTEGMYASQDTISSFLVTPDRGTLVVVGQKHHYIMVLQEPLRSVMQWKSLYKLQPSFGTFRVNYKQAVTGSYTLEANLKNLYSTERQFLEQHGFRLMSDGTTLSFSATVQGTRYLAGEVSLARSAQFAQAYKINLLTPTNDTARTSDITATPLALAISGTEFILGTVILIPSMLLFPDAFH